MLVAPTDLTALVDADAWSAERRLIARAMLTEKPATALKIVSSHAAVSRLEAVEAEFDAGWYALRFVNDPARAREHFKILRSLAETPLTRSRAEYWLGRTAQAQGQSAEAEAYYKNAAKYPTTYYGQLALLELGAKILPVGPIPVGTRALEARFWQHPLVQAAEHLRALGRTTDAELFIRHLADTLLDPREIAMLADFAESGGKRGLALSVGKIALANGLEVAEVAYPIRMIPPVRVDDVERPAIFAVARQESAFDARAVSPSGALGLMQLMPATARETARTVGVPYSKGKLTSDIAYNVTLGSAFLGQLASQYDQSYAITFAAYNAGPGRVRKWMEAHGDPRRPETDVVDWIERIPFTETRNYVQRTLENLQVYRARFGDPRLRLNADLSGRNGIHLTAADLNSRA